MIESVEFTASSPVTLTQDGSGIEVLISGKTYRLSDCKAYPDGTKFQGYASVGLLGEEVKVTIISSEIQADFGVGTLTVDVSQTDHDAVVAFIVACGFPAMP